MNAPDDRASNIESLVAKLTALVDERQRILFKREAAALQSDRTWYAAQLANIDAAIHKLRNELFVKRNLVN